ncbi:MAG: response regulator [Stackebrandtia sp.]
MTRVLIADDQELLRASFRVLLDTEPDLQVIGDVGDGIQAVESARRDSPDVVLMDVRMPEMDGIEATRLICESAECRDTRVVILTTFDLDEYVYAALRAGACGFLLKDSPPADLLRAIRVAAAGDSLLAPTVTRRLIGEFVSRRRPAPTTTSLDGVTAREHEVLGLVAHGLSNTEISKDLHLSEATVKSHVSRLLAKLGARDRAQLVIVAYETGVVAPAKPSPRTRPGPPRQVGS